MGTADIFLLYCKQKVVALKREKMATTARLALLLSVVVVVGVTSALEQPSQVNQEVANAQRTIELKHDGCGTGFCYCNGGCHTCASCMELEHTELLLKKLKAQLRHDGCGTGYCYCNGGCHTCQSC